MGGSHCFAGSHRVDRRESSSTREPPRTRPPYDGHGSCLEPEGLAPGRSRASGLGSRVPAISFPRGSFGQTTGRRSTSRTAGLSRGPRELVPWSAFPSADAARFFRPSRRSRAST